jgi:replicative DNA helicase Mcm
MITQTDIENVINAFDTIFTNEKKYIDQFDSLEKEHKHSIIFDLNDLIINGYTSEYENLLKYPLTLIPQINKVAFGKIPRSYGLKFPQPEVDLRLIGIEEITPLRKLNSEKVGKVVKIKGMVNKVSSLKPMYLWAVYKCRDCGEMTPPEKQDHPNNLLVPFGCKECKCKNLDIVPEASTLTDSQEIRIQELPDDIPPSQTPRSYTVFIPSADLIELVTCGDIIEIVGIVRVAEEYTRYGKSKFNKIYLSVNNIIMKSKELENKEITKEDETEILALSKNPKVLELFVESLAPSIYGNSEIKEAIIYQLFGGVTKVYANSVIKGEINVLLVGDPSAAKSQMLMLTSRVAPRGIYVSGRGVTAAGLTAACVKEKEEWTVQAGAMVLADMGLCAIDEIDKMKPDDRAGLHEAMSLQQISFNKAGINITLKTRTTVLAAGNPTLTRYDTSKTVNDNISNLSASLISRYDLIFILIDRPEEVRDTNIASHILSIHDEKLQPISTELMKKYIAYAKRVKPKLNPDAISTLKNYYVKLRQENNSSTSIAIAPRQLEGMRRLTEAHARVYLRPVADETDAQAAIKIMETSLNQVSVDPETGARNIDQITAKTKTDDKVEVIKKLLPKNRKELGEKLLGMGMAKEESEKLVNKLIEAGAIYCPDGNMLCVVPQKSLF